MTLQKLSTLCLAATTVFAASSAMAWESADGSVSTSASVALTSDYVWRGLTQTNYKEAIQGSFDISHSTGLYAGVWASNVDFNAPGTVEIDAYAGFSGEINGLGYDLGFLRYIYPGTTGLSTDWNEYHLSASYGFLSASVNYSSDVYNSESTGIYYTLGAEYTLPQDFTVSANVGFNHYKNPTAAIGNTQKNGTDYNIGVSKDFAGFGFDIRYYGTNKKLERQWGISNGKDASDSVVFTISKSM